MTDRYSVQSSVTRHIYGLHIKCRTTKFLCIVEHMDFYGLPAYNGAGWLELRICEMLLDQNYQQFKCRYVCVQYLNFFLGRLCTSLWNS